MEKKWIIAIIVGIISVILLVLGFLFVASQRVVMKYGTPSYRPKVE